MQDAEYQRKETSFEDFGDDGELSGAVFCTDCGSINGVGEEVCKSCGAILAEQGNHLAARMRRISRQASSADRYKAYEQPSNLKPSIPKSYIVGIVVFGILAVTLVMSSPLILSELFRSFYYLYKQLF